MELRLTDDAPTTVSYGYIDGGLSPGDEFDVDDAKGEALLDAHEYLESVAATDDDLASATYDELYERASERDIDGRSSMSKDELIDALRED